MTEVTHLVLQPENRRIHQIKLQASEQQWIVNHVRWKRALIHNQRSTCWMIKGQNDSAVIQGIRT
jgi:hypothetical protein